MIEIGRICVKLAGRDAGGECVIVDVLKGNYVMVDGNVRRRKCNILHLEATSKKIDIKKGASHEEVKKEFAKLKIPLWETKPKEKTEKPKKIRGKKKKVEEEKVKKGDKKAKAEKKVKKDVKKEEAIDAKVVSVTEKKPEVKKGSKEGK